MTKTCAHALMSQCLIVFVALCADPPTVQPPASIAVLAGSPQSTPDGSAFNPPLEALVEDANGNPVSNVLVTFNSPALAAPALVVTGSNGIANLPGPLFFPSTGVRTISASVANVAGEADFLVTILPEDVTSSVLARLKRLSV